MLSVWPACPVDLNISVFAGTIELFAAHVII